MRYDKFERFREHGLDGLWLKAADARFASSLEPGHGHGEIALAHASNGEVDRALRWLGSVLVDKGWDGFTPGASVGMAGEDVVNSPVHGAYVELALAHGRREKAVEDMRAWLEERPLRRDLWMVLARLARSDGESVHVLGGLGAWLERHPEDLGARLTKADLLQARGDLEIALLELRSLVQRLDGGSELPDGVLGFDPGMDSGMDSGSFGLGLPNSVPQDLFDNSEHE